YEDSSGELWVGTANGLNRYDTKSSLSAVYHHDVRDPNSISSDFIKVIYEDRTGMLWIGTTDGLHCYDIKTGRFKSFATNLLSAVKNTDISSILEDREGILWFGTLFEGLIKFDL